MRQFLIISALIVISFGVSGTAQAEEKKTGPYHCGTPIDNDISTPDFGFCDYYSRRFEYREKSLEARKLMRQRSEKFAAPRREVKAKYEADLQKLHDSISSESE